MAHQHHGHRKADAQFPSVKGFVFTSRCVFHFIFLSFWMFIQILFLLICLLPYGAGWVMLLESKVTAPVSANARPSTTAPVVTVMEAIAKIFPLKTEVVPSVAELPTCQKMLAALAPPLRITWRPVVVVSVEAIWKMKTALASPWASSVRSPEDISREEVD